MSHSIQRIVAAIVAVVIVGGAAWFLTAGPGGDPAQPEHATVLPERLPLPEFSLRDQHNAAFTRDSLRGQTSLLFFGFTHCPDICPATLQQLAVARSRLADAAGAADGAVPRIVLISVDPERDTPEMMRRYVSHFGEGITGVTGDVEAIGKLASSIGIYHEKVAAEEGGDYTVNHSTAVLVIDDEARLQALFSAPHKPEYFARDVPLLMASQ